MKQHKISRKVQNILNFFVYCIYNHSLAYDVTYPGNSGHQRNEVQNTQGFPRVCVGTGTGCFHIHGNTPHLEELVPYRHRTHLMKQSRSGTPAACRPPWLTKLSDRLGLPVNEKHRRREILYIPLALL